jgi:hypothetical protein
VEHIADFTLGYAEGNLDEVELYSHLQKMKYKDLPWEPAYQSICSAEQVKLSGDSNLP